MDSRPALALANGSVLRVAAPLGENAMLMDTHCHFNHSRFADDLADCLERARLAEVAQMIVVGCDVESSRQAVALAEAHPGVLFATVGVHPHEAKDWNAEAEAAIRALAAHPSVVAIGEIGLDFHYDFSPRPAQYEAFRAQRRLAQEVGLPIVVHCREAYPETLATLEEADGSGLGGVMHCWAGTPDEAQRTVALGFLLGFGGVLTFKNAEAIRTAAQTVPLESLLVETDAPYLAPVPHRGKRCEPAHTRLIAEKLAELRGVPYPEIAQVTTANARRCFPRLVA